MKKITFLGAAGLSVLLISAIVANGQLTNAGDHPSGDFTFVRRPASKNSTDFLPRNAVNATALRNFIRSYKNVTDEKWLELPNGLAALFNLHDIGYQAMYTKKGDWIATIRSYRESKLSPDVRRLVKSTYYDYDINLVQDIEKPLNPISYIIQLVGKTDIIKLRVCNDETTVLQTLKKSE